MKFAREAKAGRPPIARKDARIAYGPAVSRPGQPYKDSWDIDRAIRDGLNKVIWVFRAVHAIADNAARLSIEVGQGAEDGPAIPNHPLVTLLNQAPNDDESAYSFRYRLSSQILLSRKGAMIEWVRGRVSGDPVQAFLLDPRKTWPVPTKSLDPRERISKTPRLVDHFLVEIGPGQYEKVAVENVSWIRLPHPVDPLGGLTPLEAAGLSIDTAVLARLYNRTFLQNDGRPGGIVAVKGEMDDDVADDLDARWNGGTSGAGRISVIEADGLDWVDTAISPRDAQYVESLKITKEDILGAFGTPESIALANASQRTYENADAEKEIFWESTMLGHLGLIGDGLNRVDQDPSTFVRFDLENVEALQRARIRRREEMRNEVKDGVRTLDSYLEEVGEDPVGSPEARSYFRPMGEVPYATVGEDAPVLSLVQDVAQEAAKNAIAAMESKGVVAPFRLGGSGGPRR